MACNGLIVFLATSLAIDLTHLISKKVHCIHRLLHPLDIVQGDRIGRLVLFPMAIPAYHLETLIRRTMPNN